MCSLNTAGLTCRKLLSCISWMQAQRFDVMILVETHIVCAPMDLLRRAPGAWALATGMRCYYTAGDGRVGGVAMLVSPTAPLTGLSQFVPSDPLPPVGRVLRVDATVGAEHICLIGVYAPAQPAHRSAFFSHVLSAFVPGDTEGVVVMGGDFNCILDAADAVPMATHGSSRFVGSGPLRDLMGAADLVDVWRESRPGATDFSHWSASAMTGARLDRWLVSSGLAQASTSEVGATSPVRSDHLPVTLRLPPPSGCPPRGRGICAFPLQLLWCAGPVAELQAWLTPVVEQLMAAPPSTLVTAWRDAKARLVRVAHRIQARRRRDRLAQSSQLDEGAAAAKRAFMHALSEGGGVLPALGAWRSAVASGAEVHTAAAHPSLGAARDAAHVAGDRGTAWFHSAARPVMPATVIESLSREDDTEVRLSDLQGVGDALQIACDHFSSSSPSGLFRPNQDLCASAQSTLLSAVQPTLPESAQSLAEGPCGDGLITVEELRAAVANVSHGSVPGDDGLPYSVYSTFPELLQVVRRVGNVAFCATSDASPLAPLLTGVIALIAKSGMCRNKMLGYRPLTLLNTDVKLLMRVCADRLLRPLDYLLDIFQAAFIPGRDVSDNVKYHLSLSARLNELGLPGALVATDLTKAYDHVDRGWLVQVMGRMGFKEQGIIRWCSILLAGSTCRVRVNGFLSTPFGVSSGLFQGSALSCQEWVIVLHPLLAYLSSLQHQGRLSSFALPSGSPAPAALAFADDTTICSTALDEDAEGLMEGFDLFRRAGGPGLSVLKTKVILLGPAHHLEVDAATGTHTATGFTVAQHGPGVAPHRVLGVPVCHDHDVAKSAAFGGMHGKMMVVGKSWRDHQLTLLGRVHVASSCMASKLVYQAQFARPSSTQLRHMQQTVNRFVAAGNRVEEQTPNAAALYPRESVSVLPRRAGGLGLPDLQVHCSAMLAKAVWKCLSGSSHPCNDLLRHELGKLGSFLVHLPVGPGWVCWCPSASPQSVGASAWVLESVGAFAQLPICRVVPPEEQSLWSVLIEPTFGPRPQHGSSIDMAALRTEEARQWLTLREVRGAWRGRGALAPDACFDLDDVMASLPECWGVMITSSDEPECQWVQVSPSDGMFPAVHECSDGTLWELWPSGRLHPLVRPFVRPPLAPLPALVVCRDRPRHAWGYEDYAAEVCPQDFWLVGLWDELAIDPTVWGLAATPGYAATSLLHMTVRRARGALSHASALGAEIAGYASHGAVLPALWPALPQEQLPSLDSMTEEQLRRAGLPGLEHRWRLTLVAASAPHPPDAVDVLPPWLRPPGVRADPRPSPAQRSALRSSPPQAGQPPLQATSHLPPDFKHVWGRLLDPALQREDATVCWRMLHGTLGCRAFIAHVQARGRFLGPEEVKRLACCSHVGCGAVETLSHAFLRCAAVQPLVHWMRRVWHRLAGVLPPASPALLLADDFAAWPGGPQSPGEQQLWTRLRVATLGAAWHTRCRREEGGQLVHSFARTAAARALGHLTYGIRLDWRRVQSPLAQQYPDLGRDWWSGVDHPRTVGSFEESWASPPVLCSLEGDGLVVRLEGDLMPPLPP